MTKQYFSTLFKRVSIIYLIGIAIILLVAACSAPNAGGEGRGDNIDTSPKSPPKLLSVVATTGGDGGIEIEFKESTDGTFAYTLITAKSRTSDHTVEVKVPRGSSEIDADKIRLYGLKRKETYDISLQAVSKDGAKTASTMEDSVIPVLDKKVRKNILTAMENRLTIVPKQDESARSDALKFTLTDISPLVGIESMEIIAVDASVDVTGDVTEKVETASKDTKKSTKIEVPNPKNGQDITLEGLKVPTSGINKGKVRVFYRLSDINDVTSDWIKISSETTLVDPTRVVKEIEQLQVKLATDGQSIKFIAWKPVAGHKTRITVVNTDTGEEIAKHDFDILDDLDAAKEASKKEIGKSSSKLAILKKLYEHGTSIYKVSAQAFEGSVFTKGIMKEFKIQDKTGPSGEDKDANTITMTIEKISGRFLKVSINPPPFESDYAKTEVTVLVTAKEEGSTANSYKTITLDKGTESKRFEGSKDGEYTAKAIFYDTAGNPSKKQKGKDYTIIITTPVTLSSTDKNPEETAMSEVKIKAPASAERNVIDFDRVTVTWELLEENKKDLVKEWILRAREFESKKDAVAVLTKHTAWNTANTALSGATGADIPAKTEAVETALNELKTALKTSTSSSTKTIDAKERSVRFDGLKFGKHYLFSVSGKDIYGNDINNVYTSVTEISSYLPNEIGNDKNQYANILVPSGTRETLRFTIGTKTLDDENTDAVALTLMLDDEVVEGYDKKEYREDVDIAPLAGGTYTAKLWGYNKDANLYSNTPKTIDELVVEASAAVAVASVPAPTFTAAGLTGFVIANIGVATLGDAKKFDGEAAEAGDISYRLYYTSSTETPAISDAATVKTKAIEAQEDSLSTGGLVEDVTVGSPVTVEGKDFEDKVYVVVEAIIKSDESKTRLSTIASYGSLAAAVDSVPAPTFVAKGKTGFTVNIGAAVLTNAKKFDGEAAEAGDLSYMLYYISSTEIPAISDAEQVMTKALESLLNGSNNAGVEDVTVGSSVTVEDKDFKGKVYVVLEVFIKSDTSKTRLSTIASYGSLAAAVDSVPAPTFTASNLTGFTTANIEAADVTVNGEAVNQDGTTYLSYKLYYTSSTETPVISDAATVKTKAIEAQTNSPNTGGLKDVIVGSPVTIADKVFEGKVYVVVEAIIKSDTSKTRLSMIASYGSLAEEVASVPAPTFVAGSMSGGGFTVNIEEATLGDAKKSDGEAAEAGDLIYRLYYISSMETPALTAEQVKTKVLEVRTNVFNNVDVSFDTGGLVEDVTVGSPFTVATHHFEGKVYVVVEAIIKSDTSKTRLSTIASYESLAAAVDSVPAPTFVAKGKTGFTVNIGAAVLTNAKKFDGEAAEAGDIRYQLYYISSTETPAISDAEQVKTKALESQTNSLNAGGVEDVTVGSPFTVATHHFEGKVYVVVGVFITSDTSKTRLSTIASYGSLAEEVASVPAPTFVAGSMSGGGFTVNIEAADVTNAKKSDGEAVNQDGTTDVRYRLYYISSMETTALTAEQVKTKAIEAQTNSLDTGGVEDVTVGSPFTVDSHHFEGKVYVVVEAIIRSDTSKTRLSTIASYGSLAVAVASVPAPTFTSSSLTGFVTANIGAATLGDAKKSDGEAVNQDGTTDVRYRLYYTSSMETPAISDAATVKTKALEARTNGSNNGGLEDVTVGNPVSVTGKAFDGKVYVVVEAIIKSDASKTRLSTIASYGSLAAAGTGVNVLVTLTAPDNAGEMEIGLTIPDGFDYGKDADGKQLTSAKELWLFYTKGRDGRASQTVDEIAANGEPLQTSLAVTNKVRGVVTLTGSGPWTVSQLSPDTHYFFAIRFIHPDSTAVDPSSVLTSDYQEFARDTKQVDEFTFHALSSATKGHDLLVLPSGNDGEGQITLSVSSPEGSNKELFGTKADGSDASGTDVEYWLYYSSTESSDNAEKIKKEIEDAGAPVQLVDGTTLLSSNGETLSVTRRDFGVVGMSEPLSIMIKELNDGTQYRFFVRQVFIDTAIFTGYDRTKSKAGTIGIDSTVVTTITKPAAATR